MADDDKMITVVSSIPKGCIGRVEITLMPGGYLSVNHIGEDEDVIEILRGAAALYGLDLVESDGDSKKIVEHIESWQDHSVFKNKNIASA